MNGTNRFFIQKHHTEHPHFDLRLEIGEKLKSWILPNRLPMKVCEKALAIEGREDEIKLNDSYDFYNDKYGVGHVELLDSGYFEIIERRFNKIEFRANGDILRGIFVFIVPSWGRSSNRWVWVLFKTR